MFRKFIATFTAGILAAVGFVALPVASGPAAAAPSASAFDPGLIISDSVFFDFGSMSVAQIQSFLDSKVADCRATDASLACLKSFTGDIPEVAATTATETGPCLAIPAKAGATAAEMIHAIANSCGISPKVLLTTLQKEQGLVTSTKPTDYMYRAAMGFGCPDSDPGICGKVYVGLFNQVYRAAKQFRWYGNPAGSFTYWKPGRTVAMRYSPKSTCGTKSVPLKSQATANLYYYTPYTPNDAALSNLYGTGDSCSAYGNRNFWRFYHDWFGSPIGGGYLLKGSGTETYLIVDNLKYTVSDARLIKSLAPLGPLGEISQPYLDSFVTSGEMTQLVKQKDTSQYFLLVDGVRYLVSDCSLALEYGASCDAAIGLTASQLNVFIDGGLLSRFVQSGETKYWIENGTSRVVLDDLALSSVGVSGAIPTKLTIEQISSLTPGPAIASELLLFGLKDSSDLVIASGGKTYRFTASLATDIGLQKWFQSSAVKVDSGAIASSIEGQTIRGFVQSFGGSAFVLTSTGKLSVSDPSEWTESIATLPDAILNQIPNASGSLAAPAVISSTGNKLSYFVQSGERRISKTGDMTKEFLSLLGQDKTILIPQAAINLVPNVGNAIAPGIIVKAGNSSTLYLTDDLTRKIKLSNASQAKSVSDSKTFTISSADLAKLQTRTGFSSIKVECNSETYLLDAGTLYPISPEAAANFPTSAYPLSVATCAALNISSRPVGQFLRDNKGILYLVSNGVKSKIKSWAHYATLVGDSPGYIKASAYFSSKIPTSGTAPATIQLASIEGIPTGVFDQFTFTGTIPVASSPTPSPTPTPSVTPTPSPVPSATASPKPSVAPTENLPSQTPSTYKVVSGDTLNAIASRFGVSASSLQTLNKIRDPRLLRIGQVLKIPSTGAAPVTAAPAPSTSAAPTPSPTPTPSPAPSVESVTYAVQSGDTLWKIASKFGVSVAGIQELNGISNAEYIRVGQVLKIPTSGSASSAAIVTNSSPEVLAAAPEISYTVTSGDTLWGISKKLGVSATELAQVNQINNANFIHVGQVLNLPS